MKLARWTPALLLLMTLTACTTSVIKTSNPQFAGANATDFATIYLMRPTPLRTRGVADNDIKVEFGENQLVAELSAGEYAAFKVTPGNMDIIIRSTAYLTSNPLPEKVWRARNFDFTSGKTYYILTKFIQEEFRGMYFVPVEISKKEAQDMLIRIKPAGLLATKQPIT